MYNIRVVSASIEELHNLGIGQFNDGFSVCVTVESNGITTSYKAVNLLVTERQNPVWCAEQCQIFIDNLPPNFTVGEGYWNYEVRFDLLKRFGIPTPPPQPNFPGIEQAHAHFQSTGERGYEWYNQMYSEWAVQFNQWMDQHAELAAEYGLNRQDPEHQVYR